MPDGRRCHALFVSSTLSQGGAERFVSTVLVHLDRQRFAPALCLLRDEVRYPLPDDVPVESLDKRRPWHIPRAIARLARSIDRSRPDVVVSAFAHPNLLTGSALRLAQHRPRWLARISLAPERTEPAWLRPWMRRLYRRADRVVANSEALRRRFDAVYPTRDGAQHLPNATDFEQLEALARAAVPAPPAATRRLVSVGRLEAQKRFDLLLEAVASLRERFALELVICGEGSERTALEARARALGLGDRLRLPGFVANPFAWMASADLFVLASDAEGLPNALIEAQGLGLPAVATDCPTGPAEIIADGETGRLVPTGDAEALARAIAPLLSDDARRRAMGEAARRRARARYSAQAVTRQLEDQLLEITAR